MDESISLKEAWAELAAYDSSIWIGLIVAVIILIFEIVLLKRGVIFSSEVKKYERAKKVGRSVIAKRISCRYEDRENRTGSRDRIYVAQYQYEQNGRIRKKQIFTTSTLPPDTITLYFLPYSNKPLCEYDRKASVFFPLVYIIPVLAAVFTVLIFSK